MTITTWITGATRLLALAGIDSARLDALLLLEHVTKRSKASLLANTHQELDDTLLTTLNTLLEMRTGRMPLAYIIGYKEFYGRVFKVTKDTLIPRPESEAFLELSKHLDLPAKHSVADIGTGSGILGITYALEHPDSTVYLCDISQSALEVARQNANNLGARNVRFIVSDLLENVVNNVDILLANLPYVPEQFPGTKELDYEPAIALYSGVDGLDHYRKLFDQLKSSLPQYIVLESLKNQQKDISVIANKSSYRLVKKLDLVTVYCLH